MLRRETCRAVAAAESTQPQFFKLQLADDLIKCEALFHDVMYVQIFAKTETLVHTSVFTGNQCFI